MKNLAAFFEIPAADFGRAVKFYEIVLNCKLSVKESQTEKMAFFTEESGKCPGAISFATGFKPSKDGVLISLLVVNIEEIISRIEENGGNITTPKTKVEAEGTGYFAVFIDSEGNKLGLYSDN